MKKIEKETHSLDMVKNEISENVGKKIVIQEWNKQGKKIKEYTGEIVNVYASVFIVKIQVRTSFLNKSFSYVDFLTNELTFKFVE